jgi:predicted nucleic acid-binding protein
MAAGQLKTTELIALTDSIALLAADSSLQYGLAMADAIVFATAKDLNARLVTGDADLKDLPDVVYIR